eukprot:2402045-Prymnesium_polylepis.1
MPPQDSLGETQTAHTPGQRPDSRRPRTLSSQRDARSRTHGPVTRCDPHRCTRRPLVRVLVRRPGAMTIAVGPTAVGPPLAQSSSK